MTEMNLSSCYCIEHYIYCLTLCVCEWVAGVGFLVLMVVIPFYSFPPHWTMLVQVFLILMCIIFERGSVAFTVISISCAPAVGLCFWFLEDLAALIGLVGEFWVMDVNRVCASGGVCCVWVKGTWRCEWSMPFYCQTVIINIGNLHLPASSPSLCEFLFSSLVRIASLIAKCLNIVRFHSSSLHISHIVKHGGLTALKTRFYHLWAPRSSDAC